jgi:hypothetical protein
MQKNKKAPRMDKGFEKVFKDTIFQLAEKDTDAALMRLFQWQAVHNPVYAQWLQLLGVSSDTISSPLCIPCLPVQFFKTHRILSGSVAPVQSFETSGTTGMVRGYHHLADLNLYQQSIFRGFHHFFGSPADWCFVALLPGYLERPNASLVYMVKELMAAGNHPQNGFFLNDFEALYHRLNRLRDLNQKTMLIGVTFALLDYAEAHPGPLPPGLVVETGGMKGRRKEMVREAVHQQLISAFETQKIGSEYGMTELLSQAWSVGDGLYKCPPWMRVLVADPDDPMAPLRREGRGAICVMDLCNLHSCSFLATQDIGLLHADGTFEVLGRFDHAEMRGCNLLSL